MVVLTVSNRIIVVGRTSVFLHLIMINVTFLVETTPEHGGRNQPIVNNISTGASPLFLFRYELVRCHFAFFSFLVCQHTHNSNTVYCLFHFFQKFDSIQNFSFGGFLDFSGQHELIQNGIDLVEIKDNIQFTNITEIGIQ